MRVADTMQLVGVKRKYDEMEGDDDDCVGGGGVGGALTASAASPVSSSTYLAQRQSILNMSMCKLRTPAQGRREPSLRRSVLIFNTLRSLESELRREGCAFLPPPAPIVFPPSPSEQDMTLDPLPPTAQPGADLGATNNVVAMETEASSNSRICGDAIPDASCVSDSWSRAAPFYKAPCTTSALVGSTACGTCVPSYSCDVTLTTSSCSSDAGKMHCDAVTPPSSSESIPADVLTPLSAPMASTMPPLPSLSPLNSSCPLPPVNTFMEPPSARSLLPPCSTLTPSTCASSLNLSSISDVLLNSVPVLNSTPVATPSKDGPLSPPSSSDASRAQLFDLDAKVASRPISPVLPQSNDSDSTLRASPSQRSGYSTLLSGSFSVGTAVSMSHVSNGTPTQLPPSQLHTSCGGGGALTNSSHPNSTPSFSDVDMSLYDFDLLTSAAPNVKVAPLSAEELLTSFPADSYQGGLAPSPCFKPDFLGDDLDHIMQILVGI